MSGIVTQDEVSLDKISGQALRDGVESACDIEIAMHMLRPQKVQALVALMERAQESRTAANDPGCPLVVRAECL